jgi:hypothetical protein
MKDAPLSSEKRYGVPPPWETEPVKATWLDVTTRYWLHIQRHHSLGHLCGYIGIPQGHPWWRRSDEQILMADNSSPEVHGGITYASHHKPGEAKGEKDELWWIGFDCAHCGDLSPGMLKYDSRLDRDETYKDWDYVKAECESLARQAKQTQRSVENAP